MNKINCKATYHDISHKVGVSLSLLDKLKVDFNLDEAKLQSANVWTSFALTRAAQECELYRSSNGDAQARARYEQELDKLDQWVSNIAEIMGKYGALVEKPDTGKQTDDKAKQNAQTDDAKKKDAKDQIEKAIDIHVTADIQNHPTGMKDPREETDNQTTQALLAVLKGFPRKTEIQEIA